MNIELEWRRCRPWIEAALAAAPTTHDFSDVLVMVRAGDAQFWPFERSVCITQIFDEPRARTLNLWLCGGEMDDLLSHQGEVEAWARAQGCDRLLMGGRRGWERVLAPYGFEPAGIVLAKELGGAVR